MLALYGLKWNPFTPNVPTEALHVTTRLESFCWRVQQLAGDGGFALITGVPGCGKSAALRILTASLATQRDVTVGVISRPQANIADFYREMGDLCGVELRPHNRWGGAKILRQRWQAHTQSTLSRPVLLVDEAQEMQSAVLAELRLLASADCPAWQRPCTRACPLRSTSRTQLRANFCRSAHHRSPRGRRATEAVLRTARILPRSHHHPLRAPRRDDHRRP